MGLRLEASRDLVKRYGTALTLSWKERGTMEPPQRLSYEAQFLPAALALQETPLSPWPRVTLRVCCALILIALLWSVLGKIDIVATSSGRIIPSGHTKIIQPIETAAVKAIHIANGQAVKAGDLLVELDATENSANMVRLGGGKAAALLEEARAQALLTAIQTQEAPAIVLYEDIDPARTGLAQQLLDEEYASFAAQIAQIDAEIARRDAELRTTQDIVAKLAQAIPIDRRRARDFKQLADQDYMSKHDYMERELGRIDREANLAAQRSRIPALQAALAEGKRQREALLAEAQRKALDSLEEARRKMLDLDQEIVKAGVREQLMQLRAPVDGTVQQLAVHSVGGVVTPAQQLMVIVPRSGQLEVEAFLENKDIGFVSAGQKAEVKVETFPYAKYGTIPGTITHVSNDAIADDKLGLVYSVHVALERNTMNISGKTVALAPGMAVQVESKIGKRRVIEYFLSPLQTTVGESLDER